MVSALFLGGLLTGYSWCLKCGSDLNGIDWYFPEKNPAVVYKHCLVLPILLLPGAVQGRSVRDQFRRLLLRLSSSPEVEIVPRAKLLDG